VNTCILVPRWRSQVMLTSLHFQWNLLFVDTMYAKLFGAVFWVRNFSAIVNPAIFMIYTLKLGTGIVGHIPRQICTPCNLFIRSGGSTYNLHDYWQLSLFCQSFPRRTRSSLSVTIQG